MFLVLFSCWGRGGGKPSLAVVHRPGEPRFFASRRASDHGSLVGASRRCSEAANPRDPSI